jgi:hypothetical protein
MFIGKWAICKWSWHDMSFASMGWIVGSIASSAGWSWLIRLVDELALSLTGTLMVRP